ncbi:MAG: DNA replication and repair protein RecF, partial [Anaerolineae bacterium]
MHLTHLSLTNFRAFARLDSDVPAGVNLIVGDNAQGKTTLLEAVYLLSTLTSFQAAHPGELINFLEARQPLAVARVQAEYRRGERTHRLEVRVIQEPNGNGGKRVRREVLLDGLKRKADEVIGHFNAVLFLPGMFAIIAGSPADRRKYLDLTIAQVNPRYTAALSAYNKALAQRNALLKQIGETGSDPTQLDYWDELLAQNGAILI